jgi:hypothetical protein
MHPLKWELFKQDKAVWEVTHTRVFSINNMTDEEVRQSIIQDLVMLHDYWLEEKATLRWYDLFRFLPYEYQRNRVLNQLVHPEIYNLFEILPNDEIRIRNNKVILQAAMDYCGFYLDGYDMPIEGMLHINPENIVTLIASPNLEQTIKELLIQLDANVEDIGHA